MIGNIFCFCNYACKENDLLRFVLNYNSFLGNLCEYEVQNYLNFEHFLYNILEDVKQYYWRLLSIDISKEKKFVNNMKLRCTTLQGYGK